MDEMDEIKLDVQMSPIPPSIPESRTITNELVFVPEPEAETLVVSLQCLGGINALVTQIIRIETMTISGM